MLPRNGLDGAETDRSSANDSGDELFAARVQPPAGIVEDNDAKLIGALREYKDFHEKLHKGVDYYKAYRKAICLRED